MPKKKKVKKVKKEKKVKNKKKIKPQIKIKPTAKLTEKKSSVTSQDEKPEIKKIKKQPTYRKAYL